MAGVVLTEVRLRVPYCLSAANLNTFCGTVGRPADEPQSARSSTRASCTIVKPSAKLLYVLRTTLTGIHLLETGQLEPDLTRLMDGLGLSDAAELVERKRAGERVGLDPALLEQWRPRVDGLFAQLDEAHEKSLLPEAPPNESEVREWLLAVRRARFG